MLMIGGQHEALFGSGVERMMKVQEVILRAIA
jgi:hypothetical protein